MPREQNLIVIPKEMQERLAKRLKENGMVMFTRIEVYKQGVAFFWDGIGGSTEEKLGCPPNEEPLCPGSLTACCQGDEWSCCPPS